MAIGGLKVIKEGFLKNLKNQKSFKNRPAKKDQLELVEGEESSAGESYQIKIKNRWSKFEKKLFSKFALVPVKVRYQNIAPRSR